jgi:hypothetical protein
LATHWDTIGVVLAGDVRKFVLDVPPEDGLHLVSLDNTYTMNQRTIAMKSIWLHLLASAVSILAFFALMSYFQLFGTTMRFSDPVYMTKLSLSYACIPFAFYLVLSALVGRKIAAILACAMLAFLMIAFLLGAMQRAYLGDTTRARVYRVLGSK